MEINFPGVTGITTKVYVSLFTLIMDNSFMLTFIFLQGTPGKQGAIGSKGERVNWRTLPVIHYDEIKRAILS